MDEALVALDAYDSAGTPVIFGAHLEKRLPADCVIYNAEQVFHWDYLQNLKTHRVWDYSYNNVDKLAYSGVKAEICPIAYMPSMTCIDPVDTQDIDVLIYGSKNERRVKVYDELRREGVNAVYATGVYGAERDALIARSKIVLNIHYYPEGIHEIFRTSHLMANKKCVVSESGNDKRLDDSVSGMLLFCHYDFLKSPCGKLLQDEVSRRDWEEGSFNDFSNTSMIDSIRGLI